MLKSAANKLRREKSNMLVSWNSRMETYLCWCYVVYRSELAINWAIDRIFEIWFVIIVSGYIDELKGVEKEAGSCSMLIESI